jgi:hypothetical protein
MFRIENRPRFILFKILTELSTLSPIWSTHTFQIRSLRCYTFDLDDNLLLTQIL